MAEFKDVKQAIVEAQLASTPKDRMINSIMTGATELLSANDIILRLGITANEFEKLIKLPNHYLRTSSGFGAALSATQALFDTHIELINKDLEKISTFPNPDLYILGKARWTKETFKKWLEEQCR
ncbi:hypothetical protein [Gallibacterium salpingitidis]|uniref:Uncharacterized protein n=1 Tax=Gallibacterium salpingitidis TaxID=505341 RepID=A0A1A7NVH3_9PAST|nr:hypothetical protein [Gallibacterium salpingitidis]OBW93004.1 hypothetical protein QS62_08050 [Gallibacterium salpingitidis]